MAADHIDEVDEAAAGHPLRDVEAFGAVDATLDVLVANHARADDEIRADAIADGLQHFETEAQAVVQRAAIGVVAFVGERRPELIDEMAVSLDLQTVEAARLYALRGVGVGAQHARDVEILHRLRKRAVRGLAHVARRDDRAANHPWPNWCGGRDG